MRSLGDSDPRQVGPYRVVAGLDADELGPVLVGSAPDGRPVAVKLVSAGLADGGFRQRFAREVAASRQVAGIYTARVTDAGPADGAPWVAADLVPGVSVRETVGRGVLLGDDATLRLAAGLVGALTELHRAGLVHGDLTSVNVRLVDDGVRVLDFGVARAVDRDVGLAVGVAEFMSPEQARGEPATSASDVFSLGVVLHLAATGRGPFAGATRAETLTRVLRAQPELSPSLAPRVRQLLGACLAREPHERPTLDQVRALISPLPPGAHAWPPLVQSMIAEQGFEIARLVGQANVAASAVNIAPAPPPPRTARRGKPAGKDHGKRGGKSGGERWKPDMWAVGSAAAVLVTILFAIVMFNLLTPDRPIRASQQESSAASTTTTTRTTTTTTTTTTQQVPVGEVTGLADKCMDIAGASSGNSTPVQVQECNGSEAQQWVFSPDGTVQGLGKCLDVAGGSTDDGAPVQIFDCNGTGAQQWTVTSDGLITNVQADKCLDIPDSNTDDGTQLIIWTCHGDANQRWTAPV